MPIITAFVMGVLVCAHTSMLGAQETAPGDRAVVIQTFHQRVDAYVRLHRRLEEPLPPMTSEAGSWSMLLAKRYLASAIRMARSTARQGDIFYPEAAGVFRELIAEALEGRDPEAFLRELYE